MPSEYKMSENLIQADPEIGNCGILGSISSTYLHAAFTPIAPQSVRSQSSCRYLFTLLESTRVKALLKMLMKLSPEEAHMEQPTFSMLP